MTPDRKFRKNAQHFGKTIATAVLFALAAFNGNVYGQVVYTDQSGKEYIKVEEEYSSPYDKITYFSSELFRV